MTNYINNKRKTKTKEVVDVEQRKQEVKSSKDSA